MCMNVPESEGSQRVGLHTTLPANTTTRVHEQEFAQETNFPFCPLLDLK